MIGGLTVALVTPVTDTGDVSEDGVARLVATLRPHADALLPALSTGEGTRLTDRQWRTMVAATVRHADGLPVFAGILRPTTAEVAARARAAEELGAAAVVATTPYGPGVRQEDMVRHFTDLTRASGLPVIVYHESWASGNSLDRDTLLRICALPGIAAVKDSAGDPRATRELIAAHPGVPVLQGLEHLLLECGSPGPVARVPPARRRPARSPKLFEQGGPPLAAPGTDPSTSSTRACTRHAESTLPQALDCARAGGTPMTPQGPPSGRTTGPSQQALGGCVVALGNVEPGLCRALLGEPAAADAARLTEACARYGLDRDDWYLTLKTELHRRGVLETAREVPEPMDKEVPR
ncbi:dihydrodipicolinate synthase family protein [Streptomyces sp. HUAS TT20]|uniref:dihydrodipicolinate synthase family protein n=1 Tax=Streptomyces sp. HUAS TT20 TaxID=3447509 RepID=UPI0021D93089|nr:dihydrodipicolinate synthase family protein [Streptomyces sp. HUAS 15-9]UXY27149.1 dihydrodipicolinate synthase family protein [Streptomyces sp. HUAS 15-9]